LISINIQCENKSSNVEEEKLWSLHGTFKWSDQNDDLYIDSLIEPDNSKNILFLNKQSVKRKSKKAKPNTVWMSKDCLLLRKEVRFLGNRLPKEPNNNALRLTFCNCRRKFNKLKNKLKK
jgi:hypothetical protein